ncbi:MAG: HlyD family efflux transporter periplasmic adaptor subunit [Desulfovibrionaceae bacterium]
MNASSEQGIRLDWPQVKPPRKPCWARGIGLFVILCIIFAGIGWWWWTAGVVNASTAMVDGRTYTVTPRMTDTVTQVLVKVGQSVEAGQPLVRLSGTSYHNALAEARQNVQGLRPPTMEETAERVARAEAAEAAMVQRIALARGEESNRRKIIEDSVAAHVKAQLAVRSMDAQGLQSQAAYAKVQQAEVAAHARMEHARTAAEEASRVRTAVEGELQRVRREIEQYRAQNTGSPASQTVQTRLPVASPVDDVSVLTAPVAGRVAVVQAVAGQRVERGQAVVHLVPLRPSSESGTGEDLWILAVFPEKDITNIRPGQACTVRLDSYAEQRLQGEVEAIIPATAAIMELLQAPASKKQGQPPQSAGFIPVRVKLLPHEGGGPDMFLGMGATVSIQTRTLPAFLSRWL